MFGASSAHGSKPWFIVSELYERGSLVEWLLTMARDDYATPREVDQFRFISQIAGGMDDLHAQGVVHGDLKCENVSVNAEGNCAIAEFGQSELKDDVYRLSGCQRPNEMPRWKAPEILDGAASPTMQADIYAFAICCVEILNMGGIPYSTRDDEDIRRIVLEHDARPKVSDTPLSR
ncbi:kinase-like protein [Suillus hirtellus]|nr:kinase-like protein [Suillus hirtellus]